MIHTVDVVIIPGGLTVRVTGTAGHPVGPGELDDAGEFAARMMATAREQGVLVPAVPIAVEKAYVPAPDTGPFEEQD